MNKEQFLKELKKIDKKRSELISEYLTKNIIFAIGTKFKDTKDNKYVVCDLAYNEKINEIIYYLDDITNRTTIAISESALNSYCLNNYWIQINNLKK